MDKGDYVEIRLTTGAVLKLLKWEEQIMSIMFDVNEKNQILGDIYVNKETAVVYRINNPDPEASIYFEATNGWSVVHDPKNKTITLNPNTSLQSCT